MEPCKGKLAATDRYKVRRESLNDEVQNKKITKNASIVTVRFILNNQ